MGDPERQGLSRRALFKAAGALTALAALTRFPTKVDAHDLPMNDPAYRFEKYESIVNRRVTVRQLYQWPNLTNPIIFPNVVNGINGFQFAYKIPPEEIQVVVQAYASANGAMYDDHIWQKYRLGDAFNVKDPATGNPATRNIWYKSNIPASQVTPPPLARDHAYYADGSIEGLQRRGVLFLI